MGFGQQVTQRTTQQGRPQIRIIVTCGQVVNAYQNDREQIYDLTQKNYFFFRTHGTEHVPRSAVFVAVRISTVLCCKVLLSLLFYGGGGEVLCCRLVCHLSNEEKTDVRLAVPFHQSFRSYAHLAALQNRFGVDRRDEPRVS